MNNNQISPMKISWADVRKLGSKATTIELQYLDEAVGGNSVYNVIRLILSQHGIKDDKYALALVVMLSLEGVSSNSFRDLGGMTYMGLSDRYNKDLGISDRTITFEDVVLRYYRRYWLGFGISDIPSETKALDLGYTPMLKNVGHDIFRLLAFNDAINPPYTGNMLRLIYRKMLEPLILSGKLAGAMDGSVNQRGKLFIPTKGSKRYENSRFPFYASFALRWSTVDIISYILSKPQTIAAYVKSVVPRVEVGHLYRMFGLAAGGPVIDVSHIEKIRFRDLALLLGDVIRANGKSIYSTPDSKTPYDIGNMIAVPAQNANSVPLKGEYLSNIRDKAQILKNPQAMSEYYTMLDQFATVKNYAHTRASDNPKIIGLVPSVVVSLANLSKAYYAEFREQLRITDGFRSMKEQQIQYDRYQSELNYYNKYGLDAFRKKYDRDKPRDAAKPSRTSPHLMGLAIDLVGDIPNKDDKLRWLSVNAPAYGLYQQLPDTDPVHFIPNGLSTTASRRDFLGINNSGQLVNPDAKAYKIMA